MNELQMNAIRESVLAAFVQMSSADISALVMEPYAEFRGEGE